MTDDDCPTRVLVLPGLSPAAAMVSEPERPATPPEWYVSGSLSARCPRHNVLPAQSRVMWWTRAAWVLTVAIYLGALASVWVSTRPDPLPGLIDASWAGRDGERVLIVRVTRYDGTGTTQEAVTVPAAQWAEPTWASACYVGSLVIIDRGTITRCGSIAAPGTEENR